MPPEPASPHVMYGLLTAYAHDDREAVAAMRAEVSDEALVEGVLSFFQHIPRGILQVEAEEMEAEELVPFACGLALGMLGAWASMVGWSVEEALARVGQAMRQGE